MFVVGLQLKGVLNGGVIEAGSVGKHLAFLRPLSYSVCAHV